MKKLFAIIPLVLVSCANNTGQTGTAGAETAAIDQNFTTTALDLTTSTLSDENYAKDKVGKTVEMKNVYLGGTDGLAVWGSDGDIPKSNGVYTCCRYIFKVANAEELKNAIHGRTATVTALLKDFRENIFTPPYGGGPVVLKEFVFENATIALNPEVQETKNETQPETSSTEEQEETVDTFSADNTTNTVSNEENADGTLNGVIISDKAYFHEEKDRSTRKKAYLIKGDKIRYFQSVKGDFNMVFFTNSKGVYTYGWMLKSDIK